MKKTFCLLTLAGLTAMNVYGQFNVTTTNNANTLVTNLVGTGITASNATLNGAPVTAQGTFTCTGGCNLGFSSGIILTSGSAVVATLPNTGTAQGAMFPVSLSDPDLQSLATAQVFDACVLQFDFWVASDRMRFNYIFGSDEYSDYVNTAFNDVFGFFLSGPGITPSPRNIAIVPGTPNTPVAINNVNNGGPVGHGIPPPGPCMNCAYFRDNTVPVTYTTAWDGLTTPLMAQAKVCPCETYQIKLAVSDVNDQIFDSGVLLEHQSFSSVGQAAIYANGVQVPNNHIIELCPGQSVTLCVLHNMTCTNNLNFAWNGGMSGTTQCITVTQANLAPNGNYACVITHTINNQCFVWTTTVKVVYINPPANASISGPTSVCQGGSVTLTANPAGYNYQWSTGANTQSINVSSAGTYTVTVSNVCGSVTASATVTVGNAQASISGVTAICSGASTTLTANAGQSYQWSTGQVTQSITVNTAGTYTVTVTQAGGCTASASVNVTVNNSPAPTIAGNLNICPGVSTVLNAGAGYASYQWSSGGSISQFLNVSTPGTYTVTVTDANGCTGSASATVNQLPAPTPTITGITAFCQGGNTTLNAGAGYSSYQWNTGNNNQTINVTTAGTYTVTVTNNFGCTGSASANVTVYTNPTPTISGNLTFCSGSNTTLTATPGFNNYQWSNGANTSSITVNNAATYTVTVTDANGCVGSASVTTTVNPLPSPVIAGNNTICQNQTTTFDAGAGYASYQWSNGNNSQTITTGTAGNYVVTVTDANGCTASASVTLTVNPLPTPSISGNTVFCQGDQTVLDAGAGYQAYLWSNGSAGQTITTGTAGNYVVTVTDANGCTNTASVTVIVNPLPTPQITGNNSICDGTTTTLSAGNYVSYQWSNGSNSSTITVSTAGNYVVTVTDANGCVGTSQAFTVVVNPLPTAVISQNSVICEGESAQVNLVFTGTPPFNFTYSNGQQNFTGTSAAHTTTLTLSPTATTTYTLVSVTDANCPGSVSGNAVITVNPLPVPVITGNNVICDGASTTFTTGPFVSYQWSNGANTQQITIQTAGFYTVTVTDQNGCTASATHQLIVNPTPIIAFTNDSSQTCNKPFINFFNYSIYPPGSVFLWDFGDGSQSSQVSPSHIYAAPGPYLVSLTITTPHGCTSTLEQNIVVEFLPFPVADFYTDREEVSITNATIRMIDQSQHAVSWFWDFGDGKYSTEQNPTHTFSDYGKFRIKQIVTNVSGCTDEAVREVYVTPFFVPNAFTPNGDGLNDYFFNVGYEMNLQFYRMAIWNRWGQKIFETDNPNSLWDGRVKDGNPAPEGVYVYQIKFVNQSGKDFNFEGRVTLLR